MKKRTYYLISLTLLFALILSACGFSLPPQANLKRENNNPVEEQTSTKEITVSNTPTPNPEAKPETTPTPDSEGISQENGPGNFEYASTDPTEEKGSGGDPDQEELKIGASGLQNKGLPVTIGPENFPAGVNPLTGQNVENPEFLNLPPALISISNFPASARPQAGLNSSPITFELAIGEGMTRFLAVFYGTFPEKISGQTEGQSPDNFEASIGPIRSGRLPYEDIRSFYNGFLVMASAYSGVAQTLSQTTTIYGSDSDDINSALIGVDKIKDIAQFQADKFLGRQINLDGMKFSDITPASGSKADLLWVFYSNLNQIQWKYDAESGTYIRYDIKTDGSGEFVMSTDRLTGEPISKENVIVIFATHNFIAPTLIDIQLTNIPPMRALLFRDGEVHEIFWTTQFGEYEQETGLLRPMRFVDEIGNTVALKPGQTWIQIVTTSSYYLESAISDTPFFPTTEEAGTGRWLVRYKGKY